jgi:hypothetical protein
LSKGNKIKKPLIFLTGILIQSFLFSQEYVFSDFIGTWNGNITNDQSWPYDDSITIIINANGSYSVPYNPGNHLVSDLYPGTEEVSYNSSNNILTYQWVMYYHYSCGGPCYASVPFQVMTFENGELTLYYNNGSGPAPQANSMFLSLEGWEPPVTIVDVPTYNNEDWNIIGNPIIIDNNNYQEIFPYAIENTLYTFSQTGYIQENNIIPGKGYWLRFSEDNTTVLTGEPIVQIIITIVEGWNLISGITESIAIINISDPSSIIINGTVFGFGDVGYIETEVLEPGKGYWIRANDSGSIILTSY